MKEPYIKHMAKIYMNENISDKLVYRHLIHGTYVLNYSKGNKSNVQFHKTGFLTNSTRLVPSWV